MSKQPTESRQPVHYQGQLVGYVNRITSGFFATNADAGISWALRPSFEDAMKDAIIHHLGGTPPYQRHAVTPLKESAEDYYKRRAEVAEAKLERILQTASVGMPRLINLQEIVRIMEEKPVK